MGFSSEIFLKYHLFYPLLINQKQETLDVKIDRKYTHIQLSIKKNDILNFIDLEITEHQHYESLKCRLSVIQQCQTI